MLAALCATAVADISSPVGPALVWSGVGGSGANEYVEGRVSLGDVVHACTAAGRPSRDGAARVTLLNGAAERPRVLVAFLFDQLTSADVSRLTGAYTVGGEGEGGDATTSVPMRAWRTAFASAPSSAVAPFAAWDNTGARDAAGDRCDALLGAFASVTVASASARNDADGDEALLALGCGADVAAIARVTVDDLLSAELVGAEGGPPALVVVPLSLDAARDADATIARVMSWVDSHVSSQHVALVTARKHAPAAAHSVQRRLSESSPKSATNTTVSAVRATPGIISGFIAVIVMGVMLAASLVCIMDVKTPSQWVKKPLAKGKEF